MLDGIYLLKESDTTTLQNFLYKIGNKNDISDMLKPNKELGQIVTYGKFIKDELVAIGSITCFRVCPYIDTPNASGIVAHISGVNVLPQYRHLGYATEIIQALEKDALSKFNIDYFCCDSTADELYTKLGYIYSGESRLWKPLK